MLASWTSPTQPNGVITNYTLYLFPSSVTFKYKPNSLSNATQSLHTNHSMLINSNSSVGTLSDFTTPPGLDFISVSPFNTNIGSSTVEDPTHAVPNHYSTMNPQNVENSDTQSTHEKVSHGPKSTTGNLSSSLLDPENNPRSYNFDPFLKPNLFTSPISGLFGSSSRLTPLSVTVPGNTTSFAFVDLLPYQTYILQVQCLKLEQLMKIN